MRQIREVFRLCFESRLPQRAVARSLGLSQGAVSGYLSRARAAGIAWPLAADIDDARLEALLFPPPSGIPADQRPMPDWAWVHRELRRPDVTLALLWEEYRAGAADGISYSWFCDLYRAWTGRLKPTMRQVHIAGERMFVDFAGRTAEVIDTNTGETVPVQIFVAVLGASSFTYAQATRSQKLPDWIAAHVRAFAYFGGAARQTVSDNLKAGITKASFYEPMVNRTYADMARHYRTAIIPARPYKPRDKAKVEVGVQVVGRWILARLRHRRFFSLVDLNTAIRALLDGLNDRPMRDWGTSRRALYEQLDRPALEILPAEPYEYAEWKRCRVNLDYHVEIAKHYYSVPHQLIRQEVEARITAATVEIFYRGKRVASHRRSTRQHRPTTVAEHMPSSHQRYRDWTHERIRREASSVGDNTAILVDVILRSRPHPEQGFRSCIGILGLVKRFGAVRVDAACARALVLGTRSYNSVATILKNHRENAPAPIGEAPILIH
ncbi:MAG: IS21 family transposase, partial [Stellaceae bacterium]